MKIVVRVKPNSKESKLEKIKEGEYSARVKAPAKEGKANAALIELLSEYFARPKSSISVIKGNASRNKVVEIL